MVKHYPQLNAKLGSHDPWPVIDEHRWIDVYRHELARDLILSHENKDAQIVDVGCGDGILLGYLYEEGFMNLYGIDYSAEGIERTKRKAPWATTAVADLTQGEHLWPHPHQKYVFDVAVCTEVLEHLPRDSDIPLVLWKINAALRPGGHVIISIPDDNICDIDDDHRRLFSPGDEVAVLEEAGFTKVHAIEYHYSDEYPRPWMYAVGQRKEQE